MRYKTVKDGEWVTPRTKGFRLICCDCSLCHVLDFRVVRRGSRLTVQFRATRNNRATGQARRKRE